MLDQFDNIFSGSIALDWTAFDQYMLAPSDFADMGEGWTSTPYSFLGQPQGSARSRWYEVNGANALDGPQWHRSHKWHVILILLR